MFWLVVNLMIFIFLSLVVSFLSVQVSENQDVTLPANMGECCGTASAFDLHVDELSDEEVHILTAPAPVLR